MGIMRNGPHVFQAENQEIQEMARHEVDDLSDQHELGNAPFLGTILNEVMRLYHPAPLLIRNIPSGTALAESKSGRALV